MMCSFIGKVKAMSLDVAGKMTVKFHSLYRIEDKGVYQKNINNYVVMDDKEFKITDEKVFQFLSLCRMEKLKVEFKNEYGKHVITKVELLYD